MYINGITEKVIGCAIRVHKELGPGLLEAIYESAMEIEFQNIGLKYEKQKPIEIKYDGVQIGEYRLDLLVEDKIVIELKSVERFDPVFQAQLLSYMKLGSYPLGLLINFNNQLLKHGIKRLILSKNYETL